MLNPGTKHIKTYKSCLLWVSTLRKPRLPLPSKPSGPGVSRNVRPDSDPNTPLQPGATGCNKKYPRRPTSISYLSPVCDHVFFLVYLCTCKSIEPYQLYHKIWQFQSRFHLTDFTGKFTVQEQPGAIAPTSIWNGSGRPLNWQLLFEQIVEYLLS